jgi:hypothetical protein
MRKSRQGEPWFVLTCTLNQSTFHTGLSFSSSPQETADRENKNTESNR